MKRNSWLRYLSVPILFFVIVIIYFCFSSCDKQAEKSVTVVSWGGQYQKALFEKWIRPDERKSSLGIEIRGQSYAGEYKTINSMVLSNTVTWDLVQVETFYAQNARDSKHLEVFDPPVPLGKVSLKKGFPTIGNYAFPTIGWSYVLAWNQEVLSARAPKSKPPMNWQDFWNLELYPGPRSLRDCPQGNIEIALLADGLSADQIIDGLYIKHDLSLVNRAFKKLDQIRSKVEIAWWSSGDQLQRELESGRSTLVAAWNGRIWLARNKPITRLDHKFDIRLTYQDAILDYDWWIIPKGAPNPKAAAKLINSLYEDITGAINFARTLGYGPPISGWEKHLKPGDLLREYMPTTEDNIKKQLQTDPVFWAKYYTEINDQWRIWRAQ